MNCLRVPYYFYHRYLPNRSAPSIVSYFFILILSAPKIHNLILGCGYNLRHQVTVCRLCIHMYIRYEETTTLDRYLYHLERWSSSISPLYCAEFLDPTSPPRARILHKYAQYNVITVNTEGADAVQHLISSRSGANSYQGQPSLHI